MSAVRGPGFRLRSGPFRNKPLASKASEAYRRRVRVSRRIPDPNSLLPQAGWRGCQTHSAPNYPRRSNVALESARPLANGFEFPMPIPAHHRESNIPVRIPGTSPPLPMTSAICLSHGLEGKLHALWIVLPAARLFEPFRCGFPPRDHLLGLPPPFAH